MTDKQVIIDGVDVSECEYYNKDDKTCREVNGNYDTDICEFNKCENSNCYYKQLQREKQNSQEAIDTSIKEFNRAEELKTLLLRKEQECEELKEELQAQRDFTAHEQKLIYCVAYDESCKTGNDCKQKKCIFKDNIKLKQTLTEIKEIIHFNKNNRLSGGACISIEQILQKINEREQ